MTHFKMENHNYYDNAETARNRWFNESDGIQNEDFHLSKNERTQNKDAIKKDTQTERNLMKNKDQTQKERTVSTQIDMSTKNNRKLPQNKGVASNNGRSVARSEEPLARGKIASNYNNKEFASENDILFFESEKIHRQNSDKKKKTLSEAIDLKKAALNEGQNADFFRKMEEKEHRWHEQTYNYANATTVKALDVLYKNVSERHDCLRLVLTRANDENLCRLLFGCMESYRMLMNEIEGMAEDMHGFIEKKRLTKALSRVGLRMKLLRRFDLSGAVEALIMGATEGIIEIGKLLRHNRDIAPDVRALASNHLEAEEDKIKRLKFFL